MLAYTYIEPGRFALTEKDKPKLQEATDAIVKVTLSSICTSDLHIKHGAIPEAVPGITVGHEMVGVVEETGTDVKGLRKGDRVAVNVETYCGSCFFCRKGFVNNCTDKMGGWVLGCRIDGGQAEYVRVPYAEQGLSLIPEGVSDQAALLAGDVLATGFWAAKIAEISEGDTVLVIGGGPVGICVMLSVMLKNPKTVILCEAEEERRAFVRKHYPKVLTVSPDELPEYISRYTRYGGADAVLEAAGTDESFHMAWKYARPNAVVTIAALYEKPQILPLPEMYGKNLTFKTGGVDGCDCAKILSLIKEGRLNTEALITHTFSLSDIEKAYELFENRRDGVMKVAIRG